jgi:hypothetical protein
MKRALMVLIAAAMAVPAFPQTPLAVENEPDLMLVLLRYVDRFNKGDAAGLANEVYASGDEAALNSKFQELRADSFGKLEVYDFKHCPVASDRIKVKMNYARIYTFGGKMNDDEAKVFDLVKTPAGWRISGERDVAFDTELSC